MNKSGEIFATNFIGDKDSLFFSNYELTQQKAYRNAKPTTMKDSDAGDDNGGSDIDLNNIDL